MAMKTKKPRPRYVVFDWKENPGDVFQDTMTQVNILLRRKGLKLQVRCDPTCEGSDCYGFMISWEKLTREQARAISKKDWGYEEVLC